MKITIPQSSQNPRELIRRCGYAEFRDPKSGETSYVRRLSANFYPRFHVYLKEEGGKLIINLHLDQKQPSYGVGHAHGGEYEGEVVEKEAGRIRELLNPKFQITNPKFQINLKFQNLK